MYMLSVQSVEQILISPDGSKLVTLGSRGSSTGTFGVFRSVTGRRDVRHVFT